MAKEVTYTLKPGTALTAEEIAMIEAARSLTAEPDEENPEIDPVAAPQRYAALLQAVARRNQRIVRTQQKLG